MKFSYKILLWTAVIMTAAFGVGGYILINFVFHTSLDREVGQAMDESRIIQFAFETAALNIPSKYEVLQDAAVEEIGSNLEAGQGKGRLLRISDENRKILYASESFVSDMTLLEQIEKNVKIYRVLQSGNRYYVQTGSSMHTLDRMLYLETMKDVTSVFEERTSGFAVYRKVTLVMLLCSMVIMFFISHWLTKPIRLLTKATQKMAEGDYSYRARQISRDEMGQLTSDFNAMAGTLEKNIHMMENEIRAREDFIAAFSHELKTPLTAIIGYADLLRSRRLDEEKHFLSANYIYTEGKRLEAMSFRLLDMIVTKKGEVDLQSVEAAQLFQYLQDAYGENKEMEITIAYEEARIKGEENLLKTVLINLVDNAVKASRPGQLIQIRGKKESQGYRFSVQDYGIGIPREECCRITEAFYMVDKSRSRSRNGAGLGLALCTSILELHHSRLEIESVLGEGSTFSFCIPDEEGTAHA